MILTTKQVEERLNSKSNLPASNLQKQKPSSPATSASFPVDFPVNFPVQIGYEGKSLANETYQDKKNKVEILPAYSQTGKEIGATNIPLHVRQMLAITSGTSKAYGESQKEVSEIFNVSQGQISDLKRGLTSTKKIDENTIGIAREAADRVRLDKQSFLVEKQETAHSLALDSLVSTLQLLNPKLDSIDKPERLARVASDMSKVVRNMNYNNSSSNGNNNSNEGPKIILYAPSIHNENYYETIEA